MTARIYKAVDFKKENKDNPKEMLEMRSGHANS
jgi:hypothetical protein